MLDLVVDYAKKFVFGMLWLLAEALGLTFCALIFVSPIIALMIGG